MEREYPEEPEVPNGVDIRYSVKELLARLDGKIDGFVAMVQTKADRNEVDDLARQIDGLYRWRSWVNGALAGLGVVLPVGVGVLVYVLTH